MKFLYELMYRYFENKRYTYLKNNLGYLQKTVNLGGHHLTYFKSDNQGKPLILIHGLLDASFGFRKLAPLVKKDCQIFLFDIPGFGRSPMPKIRYLYQLDIFAELIYQAIQKLDLQNVTLAGHSMGGLISQHVALLDKESSSPIIQKLILISSGGIPHHKRDEMKEILFPASKKELERLLGYLYFAKFPQPNFLIKSTLVHSWKSIEHKYLAENTIKREKEIFFGKKA
ncbi:MAG: alpha/beta fold hydrolase, partial [Leptospiraceae bacterium]|nr:alpha/beta fold hydrolase [Leptospiraceae bacterium]